MADDWTELNPGNGGSVLDEEGVSYEEIPTLRKRARMVIGGAVAGALAAVRNTAAATDDYGLVVRHAGGLPSGSNLLGRVALDTASSHFVSPTTSLKVEQQRFFIATTGRMEVLTTGYLRAIITNPAGSGKIVRIVRLGAFLSNGPAWLSFYRNPTSGVPTSDSRPAGNAYQGSLNPAAAEMRADVDVTVPLSGGVDLGWSVGMPGGQRITLDLPPLVITPATTLGLNLPFTGAADASLSVYWFEDPST